VRRVPKTVEYIFVAIRITIWMQQFQTILMRFITTSDDKTWLSSAEFSTDCTECCLVCRESGRWKTR